MNNEQHSNFYDSEMSDFKLSHSDFSMEEDFDYVTETKEINTFLLSLNLDIKLDENRKCIVDNDIKVLNNIFEKVITKFYPKVDGVEVFHIITDFYSLDPTETFKKLISKYRKICFNDLESRLGKVRNVVTINNIDKIEENNKLTFKSVFG